MVDFVFRGVSWGFGGFVVLAGEGFCSLAFEGLMMLVGFFDSRLDCVLAKSLSKSLEFISFGVGFGADFMLDLACFWAILLGILSP